MIIDKITSSYGSVTVSVDTPLIEEVTKGSLVLKLDPTYDVYKNVKISAIVYSGCGKLPKTPFFYDSPGFPLPLMKFQKDGTIFPTPYEAKYVTSEKQENFIVPGDLIYFHYLSLMPNGYIGDLPDKMKLFRIPYINIFCAVRHDLILMTNGYILVEPYWGNDYVEVEIDDLNILQKSIGKKKLKVQMTQSGIIYDIYNHPVGYHGTIRHMGDLIDNRDYGIAEGDQVIYTHHSEFKNTIEGKEYYVMRQWDIIAKINGKTLIPVGDWTILKPETPKQSIVWTKQKKMPSRAEVIAVGNRVTDVKSGDIVAYNHSKSWTLTMEQYEGSIVRANQIFAIYEEES